MKKSYFQLLLIFLVSLGFSANAQEHAHVHGQGKLLIAQDGKKWHIQFILPAADALGFEHEPETDEQKKTLHELAERFEHNSDVVELNGQCAVEQTEHSLENHQEHAHHEGHDSHEHHGEHEGHEGHEGHEHHDVEVEYHFSCEAAVTRISVKIFESMPSLSFIEAQWIRENGQGISKLSRSHPFVEW